MILKKINWTLKRHPFLYMTRFRLLSKNSSGAAIASISYNLLNKKEDIPSIFYEINSIVFTQGKPNTDMELIKQLVSWLCAHTKVGPGLSEPSNKALEIMLYGKGGVCSDMAQIFNNFCVINDIRVREWGVTRAPYEKDYGGHSYNEVFIKELEKWVLIDVSYCLIFYYNENPLSVTELYRLYREGKNVNYSSFVDSLNGIESSVYRNYFQPNAVPFLICNYRNKTYDYYLKLWGPYIPVFLIHFMVYLRGKSYHYKFPLDDYKNIFS